MDTRSVLERLSEAKTSTDLSHRPTRCDVDYVAALGAAGIKHPAGSAILDADLTRPQAWKTLERINAWVNAGLAAHHAEGAHPSMRCKDRAFHRLKEADGA